EVVHELPFQSPPNLVSVAAQLSDRLLDLFGQQRLGEVSLGPQDGAPRAPIEPFGTSQHDEGGARREARGPGGRTPDLAGNVDRSTGRGLESLDFVEQRGPTGYDFRPSGICSRTHSIVSLVVAI